jgi:nicotinamidase-related amidase
MDSFLPGDSSSRKDEEPFHPRHAGGRGHDLLTRPGRTLFAKRRFSAFYKTDLDQTLRLCGADTVALCGIATHWCVLSSAFDALSNDFRAVILEDCCASFSREMHASCLEIYRKNPLYPLLRVMTLDAFLAEVPEA